MIKTDDSKKVNIDLSIIVPTYNEKNRIGDSLNQIKNYLDKKPYNVEVIIVDADSPDGTAEKAKEYSNLFKHFTVLSAGPKPSKSALKGKQVQIGVLAAKGSYVMFMDADLATPLKYLNNVFELIGKNRPVAICVRNLQKSHKGFRKFISASANFLVQLILLPGIHDTQCGFKVFSSPAAKKIFSRQTISGWGFDMEILAIARQLGYQIDIIEVPDWKDIQHGDSDKTKLSGSKFSAAKAALQTFPELIKIKWYLIRGKYKAHDKMARK